MKNFRKIVALFICIFLIGLIVMYSTIDKALKNNEQPNIETVQKDTTILIESEKNTI